MNISKDQELRVGFIPWWPQNPYQLLLRENLRKLKLRIIGNPPLSLLRLLLLRDGLDVVHLHWPHDLYRYNYLRLPYALLILSLYRLLKNNIVWTVHELHFYETRFPSVDRFFVKFLMKIANTLLVHSRFSENEIREKFNFKGRIVQIRHPSYLGHYQNDISMQQGREQLRIEGDEVVFLFMGFIKPYKGVEDLISSFKALQHDNIRLLIAGNPLNDDIKQTIETLAGNDARITLDLRYIRDEEIQVYMNASDIVVFPFRYTHTSGSVLLAYSYGKPVIVPDTASIPEYVDDRSGFFFAVDQEDALQQALQNAINADLAKMGQHAGELARIDSWQTMAEIHNQAYRSLND